MPLPGRRLLAPLLGCLLAAAPAARAWRRGRPQVTWWPCSNCSAGGPLPRSPGGLLQLWAASQPTALPDQFDRSSRLGLQIPRTSPRSRHTTHKAQLSLEINEDDFNSASYRVVRVDRRANKSPRSQEMPGHRGFETNKVMVLADDKGHSVEVGIQVGEPLLGWRMLLFWVVALSSYVFMALVVSQVYKRLRPNLSRDELEEAKRSRASSNDVTSDITDYSLDITWYSIRFKDKSAEQKWNAYNGPSKVANGARILTLVTVFFITYEVLMIVQSRLAGRKASTHVGYLMVLFTVLVGVRYCWLNPNETRYWPAVLFFYFYVPATCLPPLAPSCFDLALKMHAGCTDDGQPFSFYCMPEGVRSVDCSLQGNTAMEILMTWLLLQPWIIPQLEHMHVIFFWVLGVYGGWITTYWGITGTEVFGLYDSIFRVALLTATLGVAMVKKFKMEKGRRLKFLQSLQQKASSKKIFGILEYMMPFHVIAPMLKDPSAHIAEEVSRVSILFILIADFDQFTRRMVPAELLRFLNDQFTRFDIICAANKVTKIETVGEEYVACVGVLPTDQEEHARHGHSRLVDRLFRAGGDIMRLQTEEVKFKMGVHSGPIVAGVIGTKLPRYRLFGDTINSAARMMQKALPGQLQFGVETRADLSPRLAEQVKLRGEVEMKGKGKVVAYTFEPDSGNAASEGGPRTCSQRRGSLTQSVFERQGTSETATEEEEADGCKTEARFEDCLRQLKTKEESAKRQRLFLGQREGFTPEMERQWYQWFHETVICHKIVRRFGVEAILVLVISGFELYYMMRLAAWRYPHPFYSGRLRLAVFVYCRGTVLLIQLLWWYFAEASTWIARNPGQSQALLLASCCVAIALIYISYDALVFSNTGPYRKLVDFSATVFHVPPDQVYTLNFVLFVFLFMRRHSFLFYPCLVLLPVSVCVVFSPDIYNLVTAMFDREEGWPMWENIFSRKGELLFLTQTTLHLMVAHEDEQQSRARYKARWSVEETRKRTKYILDTLMPPLVVQELQVLSPGEQLTHQYRHATIAQSDLCGFTKLAATKTPHEVVRFMGDLFGAFDMLTDKHGVYKVETVGDAYIAGMAEAPLTVENLPINVVHFGLDMVRAVDDWALKMGVEVACRVGIHYGECIGGIVGTDMQRYHLFGDLLMGLEILESTAPEGRVQVSNGCKEEIEHQLLHEQAGSVREEVLSFVQREDGQLRTSKGEAHEYSEVGGPTYIVQSTRALRHTTKVKFQVPSVDS